MDVSKLTDVELNMAMIWLNTDLPFYITSDQVSRVKEGGKVIDHLTDWNLTMPLAVENELKINFHTKEVSAIGHYPYSKNKNPLRAICEALVMIALEKK
jgi:hypothetical protein